MREVIVKSVFYDKDDHSRIFNPGQTVAFEDERAKDIVGMGLAEYVKEPEAIPMPDTPADEATVDNAVLVVKGDSIPEAEAIPVADSPVEEQALSTETVVETEVENAKPKSRSRKK